MFSSSKELSNGSVEIYSDKVLGIGSYGRVCRARCGQLPCAAKLLHDTLFQYSDPGVDCIAEKFEQECHFLSSFKHPNIVQYLGVFRDFKSKRPALLMELMDESLTKFLERSPAGPLPYHTQVNICHDVALALSYLHLNAIIHRDLSSNNVLLIGDGTRAKVTDLGMSKLMDMNPHMTPLTQCPGTQVYMPPEALTAPPHYSVKLDCFSHGVLTLQVITKKFPKPGDATTTITNSMYPSGRAFVFVPETERRKKDLDLIEFNHPLLPLVLQNLRDVDTARPSARELCQELVLLKEGLVYRQSVGHICNILSSMKKKLQTKEQVVSEMCAEFEVKMDKCQTELDSMRRSSKQKEKEYLERISELESLQSDREKLINELVMDLTTKNTVSKSDRRHDKSDDLEPAKSVETSMNVIFDLIKKDISRTTNSLK